MGSNFKPPQFGHPVQLTFNGNGSSHQTILGGFVSFFIAMFMIMYISMSTKKWWMNEDDSILSVKTDIGEAMLKKVLYNETGM